jgi:hypothetical protein
MNLRVLLMMAVVLVFATGVFADDSPFQVRYASNLNTVLHPGAPESLANITNTGASGGNIDVNVYTFSPDEQLISCCCCRVTPNALVSLRVRDDLTSNTLTPAVPDSVVVKLLASTGGACNAAAPGALAPGLAAWMTTPHANNGGWELTETEFTNGTPHANEIARITALCGFIQSNGSGYGICRSCRFGGLGAAAK